VKLIEQKEKEMKEAAHIKEEKKPKAAPV